MCSSPPPPDPDFLYFSRWKYWTSTWMRLRVWARGLNFIFSPPLTEGLSQMLQMLPGIFSSALEQQDHSPLKIGGESKINVIEFLNIYPKLINIWLWNMARRYVNICLNEGARTCWCQGWLALLGFVQGRRGNRVPDTKHSAMRRMICNMEELISNETVNLEGEGREFVKQKW